MLGYLSAEIICSEKLTVFLELRSRKTVRFSEQIMSKDKYPSLFSQPNWGYCVYYPSVLKIGEYPRIFPSFSWGIFAYVTRLDQSRASENIWWIIIIIRQLEQMTELPCYSGMTAHWLSSFINDHNFSCFCLLIYFAACNCESLWYDLSGACFPWLATSVKILD